ncbi:hypothetical protein SEA_PHRAPPUCCINO_170 [Mycobacterium phage Phrappuccino]|uniref:Uncharacterized protein n=1 Tax=Mycobacterium phage Phrappuccino TaxID=2591223 RepID=A0A514DE04_9CAUD|nr:hypothetical protein KHQ87_gp170 [Mycobacterium phage Phrappuccino]QDH91845.1 hypothetical protein SEA_PHRAPPUCCINO_170 [Mycobacterium phage Phrappuccino]QIQ63286.1 hypothetical protein SEA_SETTECANDELA_170 [Mycobacterium phage Settecandela]
MKKLHRALHLCIAALYVAMMVALLMNAVALGTILLLLVLGGIAALYVLDRRLSADGCTRERP